MDISSTWFMAGHALAKVTNEPGVIVLGQRLFARHWTYLLALNNAFVRPAAHNNSTRNTQGRDDMTKAPHLIVQARAGTGKTSTMIWALDAVLGNDPPEGIVLSDQQTEIFSALCNSSVWNTYPAPESIAFVAFGKSIAKELQEKVSPPVEASTMHSMGYAAIRESLGRVKVNNF